MLHHRVKQASRTLEETSHRSNSWFGLCRKLIVLACHHGLMHPFIFVALVVVYICMYSW